MLIGRDLEWRLLELGWVSGKNVLFISEPGTAKTEMVKQFALATGKTFFDIQFSVFTLPHDIFGAIDVKYMTETGKIRHNIEGMAPDCELMLADEIFKTSGACQDPMLRFLQDGFFRNPEPVFGKTKMFVGASNELPEGRDAEGRAAFLDRFLIRHQMEPLFGEELDKVVDYQLEKERTKIRIPKIGKRLDDAKSVRATVEVTPEVRVAYRKIVSELEAASIHITNRRYAQSISVVQASAALDGRDATTMADLKWLTYCFWNSRSDQKRAAKVVLSVCAPSVAIMEDKISGFSALFIGARNKMNTDRAQALAEMNALQDQLFAYRSELEHSPTLSDLDRKGGMKMLSQIGKEVGMFLRSNLGGGVQ